MTYKTEVLKMAFEIDNDFESTVQIKVIGVGGGGGNAVNTMIAQNSDRREVHKRTGCRRTSRGWREGSRGEQRRNFLDPQGNRHGIYHRRYGRRHRYRCSSRNCRDR